MAWFDFFWYEHNVEHLAQNHVTPEEFEEVVKAARAFDVSDSWSDMVAGKTGSGRYLVCIFRKVDRVTILPVTVYEPTKGNE